MRFNNIGIGILIASISAVVVSVGMIVGNHMEKKEKELTGRISQSVSSPSEETYSAVSYGNVLTGDVNNDGTVSIADFAVLSLYLKNEDDSSVSLENSDMNFDGKTDSRDLELLRDLF